MRRPVAVLLAGLLAAVFLATLAAAPPKPPEPEVRALWVKSASLTSPAAVAAMVKSAKAGGFNTLLVQVRARGDAFFTGGLEPRAEALAAQPDSFDPLAETIRLAHARGIRVHAWMDIALVSSATWLPASRAHVIYRHPEWLMVPRAIAREMSVLDPQSQLYLDKLTRWTKAQGANVEGLFVSPIPADAADATVAVVADVAARYAVDGIHLDYVRYPSDEFDYSRAALEAFRDDVLSGLDEPARRQREQAVGPDLTAWPEALPDRWRAFRIARLTDLVARIRASVKARRKGAILSAAVVPDPAEAESRRLQPWGEWAQRGLLDVVCPMAYAADRDAFTGQLSQATKAAGPQAVWAGIGAYRLSSSETVENIRLARRLGAAGVVLFSYDALVSPPRGLEYLDRVSRAAFAQ